jgi:hypothetical protein
MGDASIRRSVPFLGSRGELKYGVITLANNDGALDAWLNYSFGGRSITLLLGDKSWAYNDFAAFPFLQGVVDSIKVTDSDVQIILRDAIARIDRPVQTTLIVQGEKTNEPAPLALGQLRNVTPISLDPNESGGRWKWHTGQVSSLDAVKVNGNTVSYTAYNSVGEFVLAVRPTPGSAVTVDGKGAVDSGGAWISTASGMLKYLATREAYLTSGDFDSASATALDAAKPYTLGYYINSRDNLLNVYDKLLSSISAGYYFSRDGKIHLGYTLNPSGLTATKSIYKYQIVDVTIEKAENICWRKRINYQKNWTVMSNNIAGAVSASDEAWLKTEWRTSSAENAAIKTAHLSANDPDAEDTYIDSPTDAQAEDNYRLAILSGLHYDHSINLRGALLYDPYDIVQVNYNRFGFPKNLQVTDVEDFYLDNRCVVRGWA